MADYVNTPGSYSGTSGNDTFLYNGQFPTAYVDGLGGFDSVTIDASALPFVNGFNVGDLSNSGAFTVDIFRFGGAQNHYANVESVTLIGTTSNDGFGLIVGSQSVGLAANFDGGAGKDSLALFYDAPGPLSFVVDNDGTIHSSFGSFTNIEQFIVQTTATSSVIRTIGGNDTVTAAGTVDITTGAGDDTIVAGIPDTNGNVTPAAATGTIDGGDGIDSLSATFADGSNPVTLTVGPTTVTSSTGLVATNIEKLQLVTGAGADAITVARIYDGTINGGDGHDSYIYNVATDVALSFTLTSNDGGATLDGYDGRGSFFRYMEHVELHGGSGNDTFQLSIPVDPAEILFDGGGGTDLFIGNFAGDAGASDFVVMPDGTITSNRGTFASFETFQLTGGSTADIFTTGAGDDFLDGGSGDDILTGGAGNDSYVVRSSNAQVIETANGGIDLVTAYASFTLGANVENLTLIGDSTTAIDGSGNDLANIIIGTAGINTLLGMGGDDTLSGGAGADILDGGTGNDTVDYGTSNAGVSVDLATNMVSGGAAQGDTIVSIEHASGSTFADTLIGSDGVNALNGQAGNDILTGGLGADILTGGTGADVFRDTAAGLSGDTITDFGPTDRIVFSDANLAGFTYSLSNGVLTYSGGTLTLQNVGSGAHLIAAAEPGGGVALTVTRNVVNDYNGDGHSDILWRSPTQIGDWFGTAGGNFTINATLAAASADWKIAGTGDFNGDGYADILWRNSDGRVGDWFGGTSGNFAVNATLASAGNDWSIAGTGDFNGDGRADILWRNADGRIGTWTAGATGNFTPDAALYAVGNEWKVAGTGDFNGDGRADILWRNTATGQVGDWLGSSSGGFTVNATQSTSGADWHIAETGDFNGDGRTDIVWRHDSGVVGTWSADANGNFTADTSLFSATTDWKIVDTGDYNGDGLADILWRNTTSGQVGDWMGGAGGALTPNPNVSAAPAEWTIFSDHTFLV